MRSNSDEFCGFSKVSILLQPKRRSSQQIIGERTSLEWSPPNELCKVLCRDTRWSAWLILLMKQESRFVSLIGGSSFRTLYYSYCSLARLIIFDDHLNGDTMWSSLGDRRTSLPCRRIDYGDGKFFFIVSLFMKRFQSLNVTHHASELSLPVY